jgi:hypothetical protein
MGLSGSDEGFFGALGKMDEVKHVSNCDIAWFVVRYSEKDGNAARVGGAEVGGLLVGAKSGGSRQAA